ncbi:bifunctional diguanylate cyclase/phosphodiesterase [Zooshikella ganghwensis]|uniref:Sensor domain-containing phosphodiesterase n=1 Tax=Zooshikella ganghwensis TaxID=202772 RepID=A0A4P9VRL2_9GAMM|nr:bifunctional diguanylate cyclase/phosphodiesterase [Zooshikella ganghwensis]RDH45267.1 sensor domain-containing phosphodiesterase [Zooshikella ganghwensis]
MRLSKRVRVLILPVLVLSYLITFIGIYQVQKKSLIDFLSSQAHLQLNQLVDSMNRYLSFADTYFPSLVRSAEIRQYLNVEDKRFKALAVEGNLETAIQDLDEISFHYISLAIFFPNNNIEFYYENSGDPFSTIDPKIPTIVQEMRDNKIISNRYLISENNTTRLLYIRFIDRYTQRKPLMKDWDQSIAVIMAFDASDFDAWRETLKKEQNIDTYILVEGGESREISESLISVTYKITNLGSIALVVSDDEISEQLRTLEKRMILSFVILTVCSYIMLIFLIKRYITSPIEVLEKDLTDVLEGNKDKPNAYGSQDEVGSLSRAFVRVYEQLHNIYEVTKEMAERDALTKLYNRRTFTSCLDRVISRANRKSKKVALLYIDLDNFKFVNDKFGHEAGDILLKTFAERLQLSVRTTDIIVNIYDHDLARLAGDEFAVLLHDFDKDAVLYKVAERILALFEDGFECDAGHFPVSASIGIAIYPDDGSNPTELISNADTAMYQAKHAGKNQYAFYSQELAIQARRDKEIETELKKRNFSEFEVYYMPVYYAKTLKVAGVEALLRWQSDVLGFISPAEFIPIAESRGYFEAIDFWVIGQVIKDIPQLQDLYSNELKIAINISSAHLSSKHFIEKIAAVFSDSQVNLSIIQLEITETFEICDIGKVEKNLALLRNIGVSLAIDDFGAGYTSLVQLLNYPIDTIKVDKSLVDMMVDNRRCAMVLSLIKYLKHQGFKVTVEGIEHKEQAEQLIAAGCDYLQGFLYSKPMPLNGHIQQVKISSG